MHHLGVYITSCQLAVAQQSRLPGMAFPTPTWPLFPPIANMPMDGSDQDCCEAISYDTSEIRAHKPVLLVRTWPREKASPRQSNYSFMQTRAHGCIDDVSPSARAWSIIKETRMGIPFLSSSSPCHPKERRRFAPILQKEHICRTVLLETNRPCSRLVWLASLFFLCNLLAN